MNATRLLSLIALMPLLGGCGDRKGVVEKSSPRPTTPVAPGEVFGRNLLVNGDAETVQQTNDAAGGKDTPATWSRTPDVLAIEYGGIPDEWKPGNGACPDARKRYFRLALSIHEADKAISKSLVVAGAEADIDAGRVECALGGWFGGWVGGDASAKLEVDFLGAKDEKLGTLATEPPDPAALPKPEIGHAALVKQLASGLVPAGTRRMEARLMAVRPTKNVETNAVAAADNLSIVLRLKKP